MDRKSLSTASDTVQYLAEKVETQVANLESYHPTDSSIFYFLDHFESEYVSKFLNNWTKSDFDPMGIAIEHPEVVTYLVKLHRNHGSLKGNEKRVIGQIVDDIIHNQNVHGEISNYHSRALRALASFDRDSTAVNQAVEYLLSKETTIKELDKYRHATTTFSEAIIALSELNYYAYQEHIIETGNKLDSAIRELDDIESVPHPSRIAIAYSRLPNKRTNIISQLSNLLSESMKNRETLFHKDINGYHSPNISMGISAIALLACGEGPKSPEYENWWNNELQKQRINRAKPSFVTTLPTAKLQTRRREILENAQSIISSVNNNLRITTQMIDMLHNDILDLIEGNSNVRVQIIARREGPKGERKKMKEAVINELIRAGESEIVRGDNLLHSRLVIGDDRELLVSSADLTRDQLYDEFNAGIYTHDPEAVNDAIEYFNKIWEQAESLDT